MKLNAFVAHTGLCSRRKAVDLVKGGSVSVNGSVQRDPSYEVQESDSIKVFGKKVIVEPKIYIMLNKPKGYVTTTSDELGRQTVLDLIKQSVKERLYPIGRLDKDTTGLLLLTNDGSLAHTMAHPKFGISKIYQVTLDHDLTEEAIKKITRGVYLEDGKVQVDSLSFCSPKSRHIFRIVLHSGKNRVIRRLFRALGYTVKSLDRVSYAGLSLKGLARGQWRYLSKAEVLHLAKNVSTNKSKNAVKKTKPYKKKTN
jgi:23S rRNA pseudouridine2605 synthase